MTLPLKGKPGLRATRSRVSHKKPRRTPAPGLAVMGSVFKCCRPLGQQMKAYHSVMPAAVTRRPLADMKRAPTEADARMIRSPVEV